MESAKVIELAKVLETTAKVCSNNCKIDVWKETCTTCKKSLKEIDESGNPK